MESVTVFVHVPRIITLVVPSPHSSSCVRLSSIMFLAAGCATSISRRIALPSLVNLNCSNVRFQQIKLSSPKTHKIPPIGSKIIFNIAFGPRHVLITSATVFQVNPLEIGDNMTMGNANGRTLAAVILEICAFLPDCLSGPVSALTSEDVDTPVYTTTHSSQILESVRSS